VVSADLYLMPGPHETCPRCHGGWSVHNIETACSTGHASTSGLLRVGAEMLGLRHWQPVNFAGDTLLNVTGLRVEVFAGPFLEEDVDIPSLPVQVRA
jgi:hypothetical protein